MKEIQSDLLAVNVSWFPEDLELYDNRISGFLESFSFTVARLVTLILALIVHKAFYKLMKRHPGRAVNIIIYPHMVRYVLLHSKVFVFECLFGLMYGTGFFGGKEGQGSHPQTTIALTFLTHIISCIDGVGCDGGMLGKYLKSCFTDSLVPFILKFILIFFL